MVRFAVTTFDGKFHEFAAEEVAAEGSHLTFRSGGEVVCQFAKCDVLCWDSDLRGRLRLRKLPLADEVEPEAAQMVPKSTGGPCGE